MDRPPFTLFRDDRGAAAAEMVLTLPILFALMFGSVELGNYFMSEHKVVKAVRDGARFAARQPFSEYTGCVPSTDVIDQTRNVTMTGLVASGGTPRIGSWTDPSSIDVTAECDESGTYTGVHVTSGIGTPVVTVSAVVPYTSVLGQLGLSDPSLELKAQQEAVVTGI